MALQSSNIANTLLQTLAKLSAQGDNIVITRETAKPVSTLITVCTILVDSAETVAETTAEPAARDRTFEYAAKIRGQVKVLEEVRRAIEINPNDYSLKGKLLNCARNIALFTTEMIAVGEEESMRKIMEAAKACAVHARALMSATQGEYETFFDECKNFAGSALDLAKLLQECARKITDKSHQQKVINSYNAIKEVGPQMIRVAKRAYEFPNSVEAQQELLQMSRQLAAKISYAISVAQPDGGKVQNELSVSQPTIPLPKVDSISEPDTPNRGAARRRTVREPTQGKEILRRARTATVTKQIADTIEGAPDPKVEEPAEPNWKQPAPVAKMSAPPPMEPPRKASIPPPVAKKPLPPETEDGPDSVIMGLEENFNKAEEEEYNTQKGGNDDSEWKAKYEALLKEVEVLRQENELLKQENEDLSRVLETMKKRANLNRNL